MLNACANTWHQIIAFVGIKIRIIENNATVETIGPATNYGIAVTSESPISNAQIRVQIRVLSLLVVGDTVSSGKHIFSIG